MGLKGLENIEIEKEETLLLPNGETYAINKGKSHSKGGTDIFVPSGTKILSRFLKLPKEVATELNPLSRTSKKKLSPAILSKKFDTLKYKEIMDDNTGRYDELAKNTASVMFAKNAAHQENIFQAQEEYKASKGMNNDLENLNRVDLNDNIVAKYGKVKYQRGGSVYGDPISNKAFGSILGDRPPQLLDLAELYPQNPYLQDRQRNPSTGVRHLYFPNQNQNVFQDRNQSASGPELYGNIDANSAHDIWAQYNTNPGATKLDVLGFQQGRNRIEQQLFQDNNLNYDYDAGLPTTDNKRGNITNRAPLFQADLYGKKPGSITIQDYDTAKKAGTVDSLANEYGVTPSFIAEQFENGKQAKLNFYPLNDATALDPIPSRPLNTVSSRLEPSMPQSPLDTIKNEEIPGNIPSEAVSYDDAEYNYTEVEKPINRSQTVDAVQTGLLLGQLASLERDNPYYQYSPQKVAYNRIDPINTLAQERGVNLLRENLNSSNIPTQARNAQLNSLYGQFNDSIGQVDLTNSQNATQVRNQNTQLLNNTVNANIQSREQANKQYAIENARGKELFEAQKHSIINNVLSLWRAGAERDYNRELLSDLSRNFNVDGNGRTQFQSGQGVNSNYDTLDPYTLAGAQDQLQNNKSAAAMKLMAQLLGQ